jgi:hypothetical protein
VRIRPVLVIALLASFAGTARAGRTHFGWLYGDEVSPERGVELETWVLEENGKGDDNSDETLMWWAPVIGVTDQLELAVPVAEMTWERSDSNPMPVMQIARVGIEARYRFVTSDPEDAPAYAPLLRIGAKRVVYDRDAFRVEADAVLGYDVGRVHVLVDMGTIAILRPGQDTVEFRPGAGVAVHVTDELLLGAEAYAELGVIDDSVVDWLGIGPSVSWTHGRFWLAASLPVGVFGIDSAPRLNTGIAF